MTTYNAKKCIITAIKSVPHRANLKKVPSANDYYSLLKTSHCKIKENRNYIKISGKTLSIKYSCNQLILNTARSTQGTCKLHTYLNTQIVVRH